jgi:hypothetical protein
MPYRRAWMWIAALVPLIAIAFWPNYFSGFRAAPFALHAHGMTATAWILLTGLQSWSIANRRTALHRSTGLATFAVVPLFAAGAMFGIIDMAQRFAARSDPFNGTYGAALALEDIVAAAVFVGMVAAGFRARRRVRAHAAWLLATVWLVLPPVTARLLQSTPGFPREGLGGMSGFDLAFHVSEIGAGLAALWLWRADRAHAHGFLAAALAIIAQSVLYVTVAQTTAWAAFVVTLASLQPALPALAAGLATLALLSWAWRGSGQRPNRAEATAAA